MGYVTFYVLFVVFAQIVTMLHMLYLRRNHSTILVWLLLIFVFPFPAFLLYFIFGNRKIRQKSKKKPLSLEGEVQKLATSLNPVETVLASHGIAAATMHNDVRLYFDGAEAYGILCREIANAKESIYISTYLFQHDATTKGILEALTRKAAQGVDVRLLIDAVGSYSLYFWQRPLRAFREAGGKAVFFMPIWKHPLNNYINLRNHRKIYLFDGKAVVAGGMNLGEKYLGLRSGKKRWVDMVFWIEGEAVSLYEEIFMADYGYASGEKTRAAAKAVPSKGSDRVQVVPSGPDMRSDALYETVLSAVHSAVERVWIVTPYFVPDETLLRAFVIAKHKGVDVKLITPAVSDHWITDIGRSSYMRELEENGVEVYLYRGNMLHTKALLFDRCAVMLGSVNIDNRSLFLNYEVVSFVYSKRRIDEMGQWIEELIGHSTKGMKKGSRIRVVVENFMRIFSPQL